MQLDIDDVSVLQGITKTPKSLSSVLTTTRVMSESTYVVTFTVDTYVEDG